MIDGKNLNNPDRLFLNNPSAVDSNRIIYTSSDFAKNTLFYLQETGNLTAKRQHTSSRENLNSYLFFIVEKGSGILKYKGETYTLKQNDCIFIDCTKPYSHCTSDDLWKLRWVHFSGENMDKIYEKYISRGGKVCFSTNNYNEYFAVLSHLYEIASSTSYVRDMKLHEKLSGLLVLLMEETQAAYLGTSSTKIPELRSIKEYLDENYTQKITLDDLSAKFYINKFYLLEIFKQQYGMGINEYMIHMRITKAKRLLRFTDKTVEEIAYSCGMNSLHYFSRVFKKVEGLSPSEYRKSWVK